MADILKLITPKDRIEFAQNFSIVRNYVGDALFPDIKTKNMQAEFYRLSDGANLPVMAYVHGLDTEAHIASRDAFKKVEFEKLLIKQKINQSERLQQLRNMGVLDDDVVAYVFDDMARMAEGVKTRSEVAKMQALSTGKITIKENNLNIVLDYGVASGNKVTKTWNAANVDILGDIQSMIDIAKAKGQTPNTIVTTSAVMNQMRKNQGIQTAIYGTNGVGTFVSDAQIQNLLSAMFNIRFVRVNDEQYRYEKANGQKVVDYYLARNKFILCVADNNGSIGSGLWGVTPEELADAPWSEKSEQQFVTITQWQTPDPVAVWTKASGMFVPVLPNVDGLVIADITLPA